MSAKEKPLLAFIEAHKANNMPVPTSIEIESAAGIQQERSQPDPLIEALRMVKAAGYRVSKPRKSKIFRRGKDRVGPTFVARFIDGTTTRMSTFTSLKKLDWERGERLSRAAYRSRFRTHNDPPAIIAAHFEQDGVVLAQRGNESMP